jgi:hypothetical protein
MPTLSQKLRNASRSKKRVRVVEREGRVHRECIVQNADGDKFVLKCVDGRAIVFRSDLEEVKVLE